MALQGLAVLRSSLAALPEHSSSVAAAAAVAAVLCIGLEQFADMEPLGQAQREQAETADSLPHQRTHTDSRGSRTAVRETLHKRKTQQHKQSS